MKRLINGKEAALPLLFPSRIARLGSPTPNRWRHWTTDALSARKREGEGGRDEEKRNTRHEHLSLGHTGAWPLLVVYVFFF